MGFSVLRHNAGCEVSLAKSATSFKQLSGDVSGQESGGACTKTGEFEFGDCGVIRCTGEPHSQELHKRAAAIA